MKPALSLNIGGFQPRREQLNGSRKPADKRNQRSGTEPCNRPSTAGYSRQLRDQHPTDCPAMPPIPTTEPTAWVESVRGQSKQIGGESLCAAAEGRSASRLPTNFHVVAKTIAQHTLRKSQRSLARERHLSAINQTNKASHPRCCRIGDHIDHHDGWPSSSATDRVCVARKSEIQSRSNHHIGSVRRLPTTNAQVLR